MLAITLVEHLEAQSTQLNLIVCGQVQRSVFFEEQTFVGSVQPVRQTIIGSAVDGRVVAVNFERGDFVKGPRAPGGDTEAAKGQVMVEIETGTLQIEVDRATIQSQLAEQALEELKVSLPIEIDLAQARVEETRARLAYSQSEFERAQRISEQANAVSSAELAQARSQFLTDQQLHTQAESTLKSLEGTRSIRIRQAETRLAAANQEVIRLIDQKEKHSIRAFFDGYVVNKQAEVGTWISRGDPVVEVVQLDEIDFAFTMPQEFTAKVQKALAGNEGDAKVKIIVDGLDQTLEGRLLAIVPQVDMRSRLVTVRARAGNPVVGKQPVLKPGMIGKIALAVGEKKELTVLPMDAVVLGGTTPVVFKVEQDGEKHKVRMVRVQLGHRQGDWVEVVGGLEPGDIIAIQGNERLKDHDNVVIQRHIVEKPPGSSDGLGMAPSNSN